MGLSEVKRWGGEHKLFLIATGVIGAWYFGGHLIHHFDKRAEIDRIRQEIPAGSKVLNVGCKNFWVLDERYDIVNIDIVPRDVPNFVLADVRNLNMFADDSFDCVLASHVLEHLPVEDVDKAVSELNRVCKDPAKVYIVLPRWWLITSWADFDHKWVPVGGGRVTHPFAVGRQPPRF